MPVYLLGPDLVFPPPDLAEGGLLAVGGDLSPERLLLAYRMGIFPWYEEGYPILWHSPDPRCVLRTERLHVGRTLRKVLKRGEYQVRMDTAFRDVIRACKEAPRPGQDGTWITGDMEKAYLELHRLGFAHSVEAWQHGELAGGLYGVSLGHMFFGESMFARAPDASKVALVALARTVASWGFRVIDAQVATPHTRAMGAEDLPRREFLELLQRELSAGPTRRGSWADVSVILEEP
jgi:leucyl/phenylalanyl-tRNA---protein transferase